MKSQDFVRASHVELVIKHLPGCACSITTPDPEATLVQLGCVTGYLVERASAPDSSRCDCDWFEGAWVEVGGESGIDPETCGCGHEANQHEDRTGACTQQARSAAAPKPTEGGADHG